MNKGRDASARNKKFLFYGRRAALIFIEALAVVAGLMLLLGGLFLWRLTTGPVDVGFARDYIESALYDPASGYGATIEGLVVEWPDITGPLMLTLSEVDLLKGGETVLHIKDVSVGLYARYLMLGKIQPISVILTAPSLRVARTANNVISLDIKGAEFAQPEEEGEGLGDMSSVMAFAEKMAEGRLPETSPFAKLRRIRVENARMIVEDHFLGMTWFLNPLNMAFARTREGLEVSADIAFPGAGLRKSRIEASIFYNPGQKDFFTNVKFSDFNPHVLSRKIEQLSFLDPHYLILNGRMQARISQTMEVKTAALELSSRQGTLGLEGIYDHPFPYEELAAKLSYDRKKAVLDVEKLLLRAGGVTFKARSEMALTDNGLKAPVVIEVPELAQSQIVPLWPDVLEGEGAEVWLKDRLSGGRFNNIKVTFDVAAAQGASGGESGGNWALSVDDINARFDIEDMDVDYRAPLMPATGVNGKGRFADDTLALDINGAKIGNLKVTKGRVEIDRIVEGGSTADIRVGLQGPLSTVLEYIGREPIGMNREELGIDPAKVEGGAALDVAVSFPAIRDLLAEQVKVRVDGTFKDVVLPDIIKDLDLAGGPLTIKVEDGSAELKGRALIEGYPVSFNWLQYTDLEGKPFSSRVVASLTVNDALRQRLGVDISDWLAGEVPAEIVYTEFGNGRAEVDIKGELKQARLMIDPFDFMRPPGTEGTLQAKALLTGGNINEVQGLTIESPRLKVRDARLVFGNVDGKTYLQRGLIPRVMFEENDLAIDFEIAPDGLVKLAANGPFFDARPFLGKGRDQKAGAGAKAPYDGPPIMASVSAERMRTHPARMIEDAKIYLDLSRTGMVNQLEMDALAGRGDIYLRLKPDDHGYMTFRLEADDAGAALRAFDIYDNMRGGRLMIYGSAPSPQEDYIIRGNIQLMDFRIVNAPILARILNAFGPAGIVQLLGSDGISFSRLDAGFEWLIRAAGDRYNISDGSTSGASLGLTFEGAIDKAANDMRFTGTIVPVSMVNRMISNIPLVGDILAGGRDGAVLAATYSVKGPPDSPTVTVNPLAVLAPGILRKLFFEEN